MSGAQDKCALVVTAVTFPGDPRIIHNVRQRSFGRLTIREGRDSGKRLAPRKNFSAMTDLTVVSSIFKSIEKYSESSESALGEFFGSAVFLNITVPGDLDKCDTVEPRNKLDTAVTFHEDLGDIHIVRQPGYQRRSRCGQKEHC